MRLVWIIGLKKLKQHRIIWKQQDVQKISSMRIGTNN